MMRKWILLFSVLCLSACAVGPYKMEINQGNLVTQETIGRLKVGMTKPQVRLVLGSPAISDAFHLDRWDYPYLLWQSGTVTHNQKLVVYFKEGLLDRWDASPLLEAPILPDRMTVQTAANSEDGVFSRFGKWLGF